MSSLNEITLKAKEKKSRLTNKGKKRQCSFCNKSIHYRLLDYLIVLDRNCGYKILWECEDCRDKRRWGIVNSQIEDL